MGLYFLYLEKCKALNRELYNETESYTLCIFSTNNIPITNFIPVSITMNVLPLEERVSNLKKVLYLTLDEMVV